MNGLRVIEGAGWFTATLSTFLRIVGYGQTADEAVQRLRLEFAAREMWLTDELARMRKVRAEWEQGGAA